MKNELKIPFIIIIGLFLVVTVAYFSSLSSVKKKVNTNTGGMMSSGKATSGGTFNISTDNLPTAKTSEVVELKNGDSYDLTASIVKKNIGGKTVKMLAYNGSIPGPLIKIQKGAEITLNFTNNTDVETALHSHGVRLENKFDGVVDLTQKAIPIGGTFVYKVKFPDEGMFWYHPHLREDYAQELGLYGNYLVTPTKEDYWAPVNKEIPLFLDDLLIDNDGIAPFNTKLANHTLMGRFGNTMLVNGGDSYSIDVRQGEVVRFYLTNAASTRIFNVSIPGTKLKLVGGDNGTYENEQFVDTVMLSPSERQIIEILFSRPGSYTLTNKTPTKTYTLGTISVSSNKVDTSYEKEFITLRQNKDTIEDIDQYRSDFDKVADKSISLKLSMMGMNNNSNQHMMHDGGMMGNDSMTQDKVAPIEWEDTMGMMNVMSNSEMVKWKIVDNQTGKENMNIDWKFNKGDKVKIKIFNDPKSQHPMQHPIHIHGQRFLVLSTNGKKETNLVWKDTVLIKNGDTIELLVDMQNPGTWMLHCHISEHLESGMMSKFEVL